MPDPSGPIDATTGFVVGGDQAAANDVPIVNPAGPDIAELGTRAQSTARDTASDARQSGVLPQGEARYRHVSELGRGGWGYVMLARDEQLGRDVAVKQISSQLSGRDAIHQRFLHEARITGQLQHPGIVPVHELGIADDGAPFYVMKLLEGATLKESIVELHQQPQLPAGGFSIELLERFIDVCNALAFAHERNIVHRDLKPANIMVGRFGETIVVDWGLAKKLDEDQDTTSQAFESRPDDEPESELADDATLVGGSGTHAQSSLSSSGRRTTKTDSQTRHGTIFGTPAYMSPEQSRGEVDTLTPATDIYALGVILYELLTGENPFRSPDVQTTLGRVQAGQYRPPRAVNRAVPKPLAAICIKAMAREPDDRYASATDIVADLQRFLANEPVSVYREPVWVKAIRWCKRHPATTAGVLGSIAVLTLSSMVFSAVIHKAHQAELRARLEAESARSRALSRLADAREAGDAWLVELSGVLQFYPGVEGLRQQLIQQAVDHYACLAADLENQTSADAATKLELARCQIRLGDLYRLLQQSSQASEHFVAAQKLLVLQPRAEQTDEHRLEAINARIGVMLIDSFESNVNDLNGPAGDAVWLRTKLNGHRQGNASLPLANTLARLQLACTRAGAVDAKQQIEKLTEAEHWAKHLVAYRNAPRDHQLLQTVRDDLAAAYGQSGQVQELSRIWTEEVQRIDDLIQQSPERPDLLQSCAFAVMKQAEAQQQLGNSAVATQLYERAAIDLESAWKLSDADAYYQRNTAITKANLGQLAGSVIGQQSSAKEHLISAIQHLRQAVSVDGPAAFDLMRLAACYETLGNLAKRTGTGDAIQRYDLAQQCYELLQEHDALTPLLIAKWARLLANRAKALLETQQIDEAESNHDRARQLLASNPDDFNHTISDLQWIDLLEIHLTELQAELYEARGNEVGAHELREQAFNRLTDQAITERDRQRDDVQPCAMLMLVDRLLEREAATTDDLARAADWLESARQTFPHVSGTHDWLQRQALLQWARGDIGAAKLTFGQCREAEAEDQLTLLFEAVLASEKGSAQADLLNQCASLQAAFPGDDRVQFWTNWLLDRLGAGPK